MIDFSNAKTVAYSHSHNYLGDIFRYGVTKSLSIEGAVYQLDNEEGVAPIWSGISGIVLGATDYDDIYLNGTYYGKGRVESLDFQQGVDVKKKDFTASITIFDSGNLFNMTGQYYSGLNLNNELSPIYLTENFSEDFSFDLNEDKEWEFNQNIQVKFVSGKANGTLDSPIEMAKNLAFQLFSVAIPFAIFGDSYPEVYNKSGRQFFTESYDEITSECSFSRRMKLGHNTGNYSIVYTNSINTNEDGVTIVTENGSIDGIVNPLIDSAIDGYTEEYDNFFNRASGVFAAYKSGSYPLFVSPISIKKTLNKFQGRLDYEISYSNDERINSGYYWEYTQEISKSNSCIYNLSENGSVRGVSRECSTNDIYSNANSGWAVIKSGLSGRINTFYTGATNLSNNLKNISASESRSAFRGTIDYNYSYTDDPFSNVSGFKRINYSVDDSFPVHLVGRFIIPGFKEIIQPQQNSTLGNRSVKLEINGYKDTELTGYLNFAANKLNSLAPTGGDVFINNCQYSINKTNNIFNIDCVWSFFGDRSFTDNDV